MVTTRMCIRGVSRTQAHRRQLYSDRNAATLARLHRREQVARQREQAAQPPLIGTLLDQPDPTFNHPVDAQQESANWNQAEDKCEWVDLVEDQPDKIDLVMASDKERYCQKAREYNWKVLLLQLHGEYMKLKVTTNNWAGPNSYDAFVSCSPTCSKRYSQPVDLVDIRGKHFI